MADIQLNRNDGWAIMVYSRKDYGTEIGLQRPSAKASELIHCFTDASVSEADMKALGLAQYLQQAPQAVLDHIYVQARSGEVTMSEEED